MMSDPKEETLEIIRRLPDDSSYEEILRELAFELMVERGLEDSCEGKMVPNEEMGRRIRIGQK